MVVTGSRLHAVRYMRAFQAYIEKQGYGDIRPLVAFRWHGQRVLCFVEEFLGHQMANHSFVAQKIANLVLVPSFISSGHLILIQESYNIHQ